MLACFALALGPQTNPYFPQRKAWPLTPRCLPADIVLSSDKAWLQVPFSALGLVPEFGSAVNFAQSIGVHRANDFLMLGRKLSAQDLEAWGLISRIFPSASFHGDVQTFLEEQLKVNDGKSMMEAKRLMNAPLRDGRMVAVVNAMDALAERFVDGAPNRRFEVKRREMEEKSRGRGKL
jgi:Delta3-Delta2-enoyl-CoA isomerase